MDHKEDFLLSEEAAEWIGLKKSEYLSKLIVQISSSDIGFEQYHEFDHLIPETLLHPDRAYEDDSETYKLRISVRTWEDKFPFHQIVLTAMIPDLTSKQDVHVPVLTFVTRSAEVLKEWCFGNPLPRPTLN